MPSFLRFPVTLRVPQGSIVGPALFLIYVNSLPNVATNYKVGMFADDTKIFKKIKIKAG